MESLLYFFWISLTVTLALVWAVKRAERQRFPVDITLALTGWLMLIIPVGARLTHVFYEEPAYYLESPLRILEVWKGGFVYYGGLVAGVLFSIFYFRFKKTEKTFLQAADFLTPILGFGTGLGRFACFLQSCCYGQPWNGFLAIKGRHPTQLYILAWEMVLLVILLHFEKKLRTSDGVFFTTWISASALGRFLIEFYRDDFRGRFVMGLSISQLISLMIILCCFAFWINRRRPLAK